MLSEEQWEDSLIANGFSQLETSAPDVTDSTHQVSRILITSKSEHAKCNPPPRRLIILKRGADASDTDSYTTALKMLLLKWDMVTPISTVFDLERAMWPTHSLLV